MSDARVSLDDPAVFRLVFEEALLPVTLNAVHEELVMPVLLAWLDLALELRESGALDVKRLSARLQSSAASCPEKHQANLLELLAAQLEPSPAPPAGPAQTARHTALKLVWQRSRQSGDRPGQA